MFALSTSMAITYSTIFTLFKDELNIFSKRGATSVYSVSQKNPPCGFQTFLTKRLGIFNKFLPARRYASAGLCDSNVSVCPPVCPSVTSRYCVKTKTASVMISSPSHSPTIPVFWCQISSQNSKGVPEQEPQRRVGKKIQRFSGFER